MAFTPATLRHSGHVDPGGGDRSQLRKALISSAAAEPRDIRVALAAIAVSCVALALAAPFARLPLAPLPAFIPAYEAALVLIDLLTAVLLLGQFAQLRSRALLVLAGGYLFDALLVVPHALSFPGVVTPAGWLGAGAQTTAWLYMFWHGGFAAFVLIYVGLRRTERLDGEAEAWSPLSVIAAVVALAVALTLIATKAQGMLPEIMAGSGYTPAMKFIVGTVWGLSGAGLVCLMLGRPYTVLDLWLIVVMVAWFADIGLSAVLNAGRFDLGFYAGRLYGLAAASFVLGVILVETNWLYARLAATADQLAQQAADLELRVRERTAELAQINSRHSAILEASPVAIFMLDPRGKVVLWTASAERIFGYTMDEALGRLPPYLVDEHIADFEAKLASAITGPVAAGTFETQRRRRDGAVIDVAVRWARVIDETGALLGVMYAINDITERKRVEAQLRQAQKMEALGNLTGGLAHDFNNHLGVITLTLDVLRERLADDAESDQLAAEALDAATRGADLIRRLLAFARCQPLQPQRSDINKLIADFIRLLQRSLGEQIKITLDLDPDLWPAIVDPAQLQASIANLSTNARDAMPNGGELRIATGNRELDADYASQHAELTPGEYAMIRVSDNGGGIAPELLSKVFDPFFTTKPAGRGTGLGLSMVYGFMKQSGGHINVYSEVGVGTTIRLYLPRCDADAEAEERRPARAIARGGGETVLAVEDNDSLRRIVTRQLSEIGYQVVAVDNAPAALAVLEAQPVDLLFSDVVLPGGISGYELAAQVVARWPRVRLVLTSGFPETSNIGNGKLTDVTLLTKPYRREDIARVVKAALAHEPSGVVDSGIRTG